MHTSLQEHIQQISLVLCFLFFYSSSAVAAENGVIIAPLATINAKNFSKEKQKLQTMLTSRLGAQADITVIDEEVTLAQMKQFVAKKEFPQEWLKGKKTNEKRWLLAGEIFSFNNLAGMRILLYPLLADKKRKKKQEQQIFTLATKPTSAERLVDDIEQLANDTARYLQGEINNSQYLSPKGKQDTSRHPEAAYKRGLYQNTAPKYDHTANTIPPSRLPEKTDPANHTELTPTPIQHSKSNTRAPQQPIIRPPRVNTVFQLSKKFLNVQVGDFDGDGQEEIFLFSKDGIEVRRPAGTELLTIDSCQLPKKISAHACTLADIEDNGIFNIYISATLKDSDGTPSSAILRWNSREHFVWQVHSLPCYLRPITMGQTTKLLVQGETKEDRIAPNIFTASFSGKKLILNNQVKVPKGANLFDFFYVDLDGDAKDELLVVDTSGHLKVYNSNKGNEMLQCSWVSKYPVSPPTQRVIQKDGSFLPLPHPMVSIDFNKDGKKELLLVANTLKKSPFLSKKQPCSTGKIAALRWTGKALRQFWTTPSFDGCLTNFSFTFSPQSSAIHILQQKSQGLFAPVIPGGKGSQLSVNNSLPFSM